MTDPDTFPAPTAETDAALAAAARLTNAVRKLVKLVEGDGQLLPYRTALLVASVGVLAAEFADAFDRFEDARGRLPR